MLSERGEEDIWNMIDSGVPKWTEEQPPSDSASGTNLIHELIVESHVIVII